LIVVHHLAVDGVSWQIILRDLSRAYDRLARGEPLTLEPKTTSFRQWAEHLVEYARTKSLADEVPLWTAAADYLRPLPRDHPASGTDNTEASARTVHVSLGRAETEALLHQVPRAYRTQVNDVLLCALARGFTSWTGARDLLVDLEGHGREPLFEDVDVSRTVGWFTTIFPVLLNAGEDDAPGEALKGIKEYLRSRPNKGIGYGVLRYLHHDPVVRARLRQRASAEISFNYLGQFEDARAQRDELEVAEEWSGHQRAPRAARPYLLDITGAVLDGCLSLSFMYSAALHARATIEALAESVASALRRLIAHCLSVEGQDCTPSDFPLAVLDQNGLARLAAAHPNIEDIYPLSPMQAGLLFHTLLSPDAGEYVEQLVLDLDPHLDVAALERAWSAVVERHPALRAAFVWQGVDEPLQIVRQRVKLPWDVEDWSGAIDADARAERWLRDDRRAGYQLADPPLMRFLVAKTPAGRWRLLWSCHHLLLDGWSVPLVLREIWAFYEAFREGSEVTLAHPRPYRDYIEWIGRQDLKAAETFWRDVLRGFAAPTPLAIDSRPRAGGSRDSHGESRRMLTPDTTAALQTLARQQRVTLNTIVQAVWALILGRYSGQQDVLFGATVSGRPPDLRGVEAMVGLFINTLPVRVHITPDARLRDLLETIQEQQSAARQFEYSPLVSVQGWSNVPRGMPLFESVLVFENYPGDTSTAPDDDRDRLQLPALERTSYPLTIAVVPGERLLIKITYDTSRLQPDAVERMLGHWETLLSAIADGADRTIASLPLLTAAEVARMTARNRTTAEVPIASCIELFDRQALLTPEATAVESADGALTYAQLSRLAGSLAHTLRGHGVDADVPVALAVERNRWLAVGLLAVLKAGGAYVPLATAYPKDRIDFMLDDSGSRIVITQLSLRDRFEAQNRTILCLDDESQWTKSAPGALPLPSAGSLAYIIYTSGSTGRPKGVALPHAALANLVWWQNTQSTPRSSARVAQFAPISFDVCFQECFSTWASGGTVVIISEDTHRDPALLARAIDHDGIDRLFLPFVALQQLAETALDSGGVRLKEVITAGEQLHITPALRRFFAARPGCTLHNQYGPSETHVATAFMLPSAPDGWPELPPIGLPIANTQAYVLDAAMRLVPDGVAGELYLGGDCLARGYWKQPELTAERFVANPLPGDGHCARLYRTGDLVLAHADGVLEFLGRLDDQVKIRGFRVEPGEVEAALRQHPYVAQAAVVARESRGGGKFLTAYVVSAGPDSASPGAAPDLRRYLEDQLPDWMVPAAFVWMDRLPLTPSGKVNRLALPARDDVEESGVAFEPPRTSGERALAAIWSELLGVRRVGIRDHFFALGGHSLLATRMIARIGRDLGVALPLRAVFDNPVLEDLSLLLNDLDARLAQPAIIPRRNTEGPIAASFAQQRLWILEQMNASTVFHIATSMPVDGAVPAAVWRRALNEIVRRHAALRTTFAASDGLPVQHVSALLELDLPIEDLRAHSSADREAAYREISNSETTAPFDLSRGPLLRMRLVRLTPDDSRLLLTLHHIVADGWSLGILKRELAALGAAFVRGEPSPLAELPIQYAEFAEWQRDRLQGTTLDEHLGYWRSQLSGAPSTLDLPSDRPRPPVQSYAGAMVSTRLAPAFLRQLQTLGRQEDATLFMTLLSAFALLLSRQAGQSDLIIGAPVAGRTQAETEPLIGLFLNHLPIRIKLEGNPAFRTLVRRVRDATLGAFAHQDLPFELLLQDLRPERHASHTPLFQVFFNLLNFESGGGEAPEPDGAGTSDAGISAPVETWSPFDFTLYAAERPDGLELQLAYRTSLYDADRMTELLAQFTSVLNQVVHDPDSSIDMVSLVTDRSRRLIPDRSSSLDAEWRSSVHSMFLERAAAEPDRFAVSDDEVVWTYRELRARSSWLARRLRNQGISRGDVVAIYAHRSAALVSAILGVLEAGAAYLILDPSYPQLRLAEYLELAKPSGWIAIDRAGPPGQALRERIDATQPRSRLTLCARDPLVDQAAGTPFSDADPDDIACVSFTSGSTGGARAVLQRHGGLAYFAPWVARTFDVGAADRFTMLSGLSHDPLQRDIFTPLALGASIHVPTPNDIGTPGRLASWIHERGITVANLTPALSQMLTQHLPHGRAVREIDRASTLRLVFFGGDRLERMDIVRLRALSPAAVCVNLYGTTETQRALSWCADLPPSSADRNAPATRELVPLGRGLPGVQLLLFAPSGRPTGIGEIGEIYVRSPYLAAGYLGSAKATEEWFIPNAATGVPGDRMYRTGDLGRYLPDGQVELVGRADTQTKIRGFRVEPAEVEAQLVRHPQVSSAAVVLRDPADPDLGLAAYIVTNNSVTSRDLRRHVAERLPDYMVPSVFTFLDALPVTPNGKIDRGALPRPTAAVERDIPVRDPRDAVEATLVALWRQALGCATFGIDDNFFELGGHSLLAAQVLARVADALHVDIPLGRFFEGPTIAELAAAVAVAAADGTHGTRPPIQPILRERHRAWRTGSGDLDVSPELRQIIRGMMHVTAAPPRSRKEGG
jgi:amino acid adenylation domain-containing protein/non-ribosomal peptide synthase protein (TIGR01720 family)